MAPRFQKALSSERFAPNMGQAGVPCERLWGADVAALEVGVAWVQQDVPLAPHDDARHHEDSHLATLQPRVAGLLAGRREGDRVPSFGERVGLASLRDVVGELGRRQQALRQLRAFGALVVHQGLQEHQGAALRGVDDGLSAAVPAAAEAPRPVSIEGPARVAPLDDPPRDRHQP